MKAGERPDILKHDAGYYDGEQYTFSAEEIKACIDWADQVEDDNEKLRKALHQDVHVIVFSDDGWSIQHLVECRPDMTKCEIHKRAQIELAGTDAGLRGKFKVSILDGVLDFERIKEAEDANN